MVTHTKTLKRPSFRSAFSGRCDSSQSMCTTSSECEESLSSQSSAYTTISPNTAHSFLPQTCTSQHAYNWGSKPIMSRELGWMPMQAQPAVDSAHIGTFGVQTSTIWPQCQGNGISRCHVNGSGQVASSINVPLAQQISHPRNHTPYAGIQDMKSGIHASVNVIKLDPYAMGLYNPLVPYGNINYPVVVYPGTSGPRMSVPAAQMTNTMPPIALTPAASNATPMAKMYSTPNSESNMIPNQRTCNITSAPLWSRQKKGATAAAHALDSICHGKQLEADTSFSQPPMNNFSEQSTEGSEPSRNEGDDIWVGECTFKELQGEGCSNLFATWHGSRLELVAKFNHLQMDAKIIERTLDPNVYNVVFETHTNARRAFYIQKEIRVRMVPPKQSHRNWLRNPSPSYVVKFETKYRMQIRRGKSTSHEIVGTFLMSNFSERKGCNIWADQLKGNRIRVVGCDGRFMFPDGTIEYLKKFPSNDAKPIGWVSYRSRKTKEDFVLRRSGNKMSDYLYCK